jgi:F0F1-type ATP synthase membrane subunit b/b'
MVEKRRSMFDSFDRLSSREKLLVGGLFGAFLVTVVTLLWMYIGNQVSTQAEQNDSIRTTLTQINTLKADFLVKKAKLDAVRELLEKNPIRLVQLMEREAKAQDIEIEDFKESTGFLTNNRRRFQKRSDESKPKTVKELKWEAQSITIRRISLDQLTSFISNLENRREPVRVTRLEVSTLNSDRQVLREIRMTVATYRYEEVEI